MVLLSRPVVAPPLRSAASTSAAAALPPPLRSAATAPSQRVRKDLTGESPAGPDNEEIIDEIARNEVEMKELNAMISEMRERYDELAAANLAMSPEKSKPADAFMASDLNVVLLATQSKLRRSEQTGARLLGELDEAHAEVKRHAKAESELQRGLERARSDLARAERELRIFRPVSLARFSDAAPLLPNQECPLFPAASTPRASSTRNAALTTPRRPTSTCSARRGSDTVSSAPPTFGVGSTTVGSPRRAARADERLDAISPDALRQVIRRERRTNERLRMSLHLQAKMPGIDAEWGALPPPPSCATSSAAPLIA